MHTLQRIVDLLLSAVIAMISGTRIAEAKDVKFSEMSEIRTPERRVLQLAGLVFQSSFAVRSIDVKRAGDAVVVQVKLTPARSGLTGSFQIEVPLWPETTSVLFGRELAPVWGTMMRAETPKGYPGTYPSQTA